MTDVFEATLGRVFTTEAIGRKDIPVEVRSNVPLDLCTYVQNIADGLNRSACIAEPGYTVFRVTVPQHIHAAIAVDDRVRTMSGFYELVQQRCPRGFVYIGYVEIQGVTELLYTLNDTNTPRSTLTYAALTS